MMKAWVLDSIGDINLKDVDKPVLTKGMALVKVGAAGICGSDIPRIYRDGAHNMPLIPGHEFSGTVEAVYDEHFKNWINKRVGVFPLIPCGECDPCINKKYEMCRHYNYLGSRCNGGFAEYVAVPVANLIELPDNVSLEEAAMLEPLAVAMHAIRQFINNDIDVIDKSFVICGLGTIGLMLLMLLLGRIEDKRNIYVIGSKESQRNMAISLGILEDHYVNGKERDVLLWAQSVFGESGPDYYFECVGTNKTIADGINMVKPGGCIQLVGNPASDMELDKNTYWKILRNQLTIKGTWNSSFTREIDDDWHNVINLLSEGKLPTRKLITGEYDIEHFSEGLELMRDKTSDYIKLILKP